MVALVLPGESDERWRLQARCRDGAGSLTPLFFSDDLDDIAAAKAFCAECPVTRPCLEGALARREPWGVWGGQLVWRGKVLAMKRRRGRPPLPRDPVTGEVVRDPARVAELRAQDEAELRAQDEAELRAQGEAELRAQGEAELRASVREVAVELVAQSA